MGKPCVQVARGLLLHGEQIRDGKLGRRRFMQTIGVNNGTFRTAGAEIGATRRPGLRFFDSTEKDAIAFGPGAGLVLGLALGSSSLRAALVDANGDLHHHHEAPPQPRQLAARPERVLDRIRDAAAAVLEPAYDDPQLTVEGTLPLLGVSVAWPTPITRQKLPVGHALQHDGWRSGRPLPQHVASHLGIEEQRSHALNDAAAAAIAVAYAETTSVAHQSQQHPRLAVVVRLAGGIGGAMVVIEPPQDDPEFGPTSGFPKSVLIGGVNHLAGEIGHVPINDGLVAQLNTDLAPGLRPLEPGPCSCRAAGDRPSDHLEAYAAAPALARRIDPERPWGEVLEGVLAEPHAPAHRKALKDVGMLLAEALQGPLTILNPSRVVLTGPLAVPEVRRSFRERMSRGHCFGSHPHVEVVEGEENRFVGVQGAGLVVLRRLVHRELVALLDGSRHQLVEKLRGLVTPLAAHPWA